MEIGIGIDPTARLTWDERREIVENRNRQLGRGAGRPPPGGAGGDAGCPAGRGPAIRRPPILLTWPARAAARDRAASPGVDYSAGDRVRHAKFGVGQVVEASGGKVTVRFGGQERTFVPEMAPLSKE